MNIEIISLNRDDYKDKIKVQKNEDTIGNSIKFI